MITVLTICSVNYLAQARTLGDSLREHNPDYHFVIGLVDRWPTSLAVSNGQHYEMVPVNDLEIPEFEDMVSRYTIVELNTAVKPFYMEYLYQRDSKVEAVIYFDPDILILNSLKPIQDKLNQYDIILTPHCCSYNIDDQAAGYELNMLGTGIYNLGFIASSRTQNTYKFLQWWKKRLEKYCYYRPGRGEFVDQLWVMLAPLYFDRVFVEKNPGYNMAYWNLTERKLSIIDGRYCVNRIHNLLFYHFSSYRPEEPTYLSIRSPSVLLSEHPELAPLCADYKDRLIQHGYTFLRDHECAFYSKRAEPPPTPVMTQTPFKKFVKRVARGLIRLPPARIQQYCQKMAWFIAENTPVVTNRTESKRTE